MAESLSQRIEFLMRMTGGAMPIVMPVTSEAELAEARRRSSPKSVAAARTW
jgi:hypothetical protein